MEKKTKWISVIVFVMCVFFLYPQSALGQDYTVLGEEEMEKIEKALQEGMEGTKIEEKISIKEIFEKLMKGDINGVLEDTGRAVVNLITSEVFLNKEFMLQVILIAVVAAFFSNFSSSFGNECAGETGYYVTYLLLFSIILRSCYILSQITTNAISHTFTFMEVLTPAYCIAISFATGASTSAGIYEVLMVAITLCQWLMLHVLIPCIHLFLVLKLLNHVTKESQFTKLAQLMKQLIQWGLKSMIGIVVGVQVIQSLILPAYDSVKHNALEKGLQSLPGVGNGIGAITSTFVGAAVLIKNSIGVVGILAIFLVLIVPIVKVFLFSLGYRLTAAVIQPVSQKPIVECISSAWEVSDLLMQALLSSGALFTLSIAMIAITTK